MIELVAALLFVTLLLFIAYPFFRPPPQASAAAIRAQSKLDELLNEKEEAYLSLKDIELEVRMGKLSRPDYEMLKQESENKAIEVLKKIEDVHASIRQSDKKSVKKT
ncbi:MAG: hypothetical protein HY315_08385 [Acidobacteria bacterium]|nr:hypothetical protein [Acidobacteriota bacterium]